MKKRMLSWKTFNNPIKIAALSKSFRFTWSLFLERLFFLMMNADHTLILSSHLVPLPTADKKWKIKNQLFMLVKNILSRTSLTACLLANPRNLLKNLRFSIKTC